MFIKVPSAFADHVKELSLAVSIYQLRRATNIKIFQNEGSASNRSRCMCCSWEDEDGKKLQRKLGPEYCMRF